MQIMKSEHLGELEKKIMEIIWEKKHCTARDVLMGLDTEKHLAYTTIATILQRLFDKGLLTKQKNKVGFIYSPKISREKFTKNIAQSFLRNFINSFGDTAVASFADSIDKLPPKRREYLLRLLDENEKI
jgi:predicted transcriptional regulator